MYVDNKRSWLLHGDCHEQRTEGGIEEGSIIGILLDLHAGYMRFSINDEPHGPMVAFNNLVGHLFPAVSINRRVQVTITAGLEPPPSLVDCSPFTVEGCLGNRNQNGSGINNCGLISTSASDSLSISDTSDLSSVSASLNSSGYAGGGPVARHHNN